MVLEGHGGEMEIAKELIVVIVHHSVDKGRMGSGWEVREARKIESFYLVLQSDENC